MKRPLKKMQLIKHPWVWLFSFFVCIVSVSECPSQEMDRLKIVLELPSLDDLTLEPNSIIDICSKSLIANAKNKSETTAQLLLARAKALARVKRYEESLRDLGEYISISKDTDIFRQTRASVFFSLERLDDAEADVKEGIRINPTSAPLHVAYAALLYAKHDLSGYLKTLEQAAVFDPNYAVIYFYRGVFFHRLDAEKCLANINKFIELSPYCPGVPPEEPFYLRGVSLSLLNRPDEALSSLLFARKLNPTSADIAREIAETYGEAGKFHMAALYADEFARLCRTEPADPAIHSLRAEFYFRIGKTKQAVEFAERYLMSTKDDPLQFGAIAYLHLVIRNYRVALQFFDKAIEHRPDDYLALVGKAKILSSCPDNTLRDGLKAIKLATTAYEGLEARRKSMRWMSAMALAQAYAEVGDFKQAVQFAERSLELAGTKFGRKNEIEEKISLFKRNIPYRLQEN